VKCKGLGNATKDCGFIGGYLIVDYPPYGPVSNRCAIWRFGVGEKIVLIAQFGGDSSERLADIALLDYFRYRQRAACQAEFMVVQHLIYYVNALSS
jgi:hypothetical protein